MGTETFRDREGRVWVGPGPLGPPLADDNLGPWEEEREKREVVEAHRRKIREHMKAWEEVEYVRRLPAGHPEREAWEQRFLRDNPWWGVVPRNQWPDK